VGRLRQVAEVALPGAAGVHGVATGSEAPDGGAGPSLVGLPGLLFLELSGQEVPLIPSMVRLYDQNVCGRRAGSPGGSGERKAKSLTGPTTGKLSRVTSASGRFQDTLT
jgi:hypothetical protein